MWKCANLTKDFMITRHIAPLNSLLKNQPIHQSKILFYFSFFTFMYSRISLTLPVSIFIAECWAVSWSAVLLVEISFPATIRATWSNPKYQPFCFVRFAPRFFLYTVFVSESQSGKISCFYVILSIVYLIYFLFIWTFSDNNYSFLL